MTTLRTNLLFAWLLLAFAIGLLIGLYANEFTPNPFDRRTKRQRTGGAVGGNVSQWDRPIPTRRVG